MNCIGTGRRGWDHSFQLLGCCLPTSDTITSAVPPALEAKLSGFVCVSISFWLAELKNKASFTSSPAQSPTILCKFVSHFVILTHASQYSQQSLCAFIFMTVAQYALIKLYLRFQTSARAACMHKSSCKFILFCQTAILLLQNS